MKRTGFLVLLCLCLILGACFATAGAEDIIEISTPEQLKALVADVAADANNYQGKTVKLLNDINLGGDTWTPIHTFKGEFNGNGKTIRNFVIDGTADGSRVGFFRFLDYGSKVYDLTLQDVTATVGNGRFGTLAYNNCSTDATNIHIKNITVKVTNANAWVGGFSGWSERSHSNCSVENLKVIAPNGADVVAGFVGIANSNGQSYSNCSVKDFSVSGSTAFELLGGFIAQTQVHSYHNTLTNCSVTGLNFSLGDVNKAVAVGGFMGQAGSYLTMSNCSAEGTIDASGLTNTAGEIGGFFGNYGWSGGYASNYTLSLTKCIARVDVTSGGPKAGGFVGFANSFNKGGAEGDSRYAILNNCEAHGNVSNSNGVAGGFIGIADRGDYLNCVASGKVSGTVAGGFIGEVKDWKPSFTSSLNASQFHANLEHDPNQIKLSGCKAVGTVLGTEKAGGLIGNVGQSLNGTAAEGAAGELIIINSTAAPAVIGANMDTQVAPYLNSVANSKTTKMEKLRGKRTTANPTDGSKTLAMDRNGNVTIPEGGANVAHTDDPELEWIPAGSIIHRDGSITLPGANAATTTPPKTGVDSADRFIPMALLSLLCMAALVTLRRKERRS